MLQCLLFPITSTVSSLSLFLCVRLSFSPHAPASLAIPASFRVSRAVRYGRQFTRISHRTDGDLLHTGDELCRSPSHLSVPIQMNVNTHTHNLSLFREWTMFPQSRMQEFPELDGPSRSFSGNRAPFIMITIIRVYDRQLCGRPKQNKTTRCLTSTAKLKCDAS